jgi:diacylglycerol kinase family enzyme
MSPNLKPGDMMPDSAPLKVEAKFVAVLLNGNAGTCDIGTATALIEKLGAEYGVDVKVIAFAKGSDLTALAREAAERGATIVAAGGGDGTINAVASALVGTDVALGVLPLGTLNHFAKDLGIPLKLEDAVHALFNGVTAEVDIAEINGKVFLNNSSLGLYPRIVRQREAQQKRGLPKWIALLPALFYVARNHASLYLRLKVDDAQAEFRKTPFIFIGNNKYELAGLQIGKRNSLAGARLWICKAPDASRGGLLRLTLRALAGRLKDQDLEATEAKEAWIETHARHAHVSTDGEVFAMEGPLHYKSRPQALKVIVPQRAQPAA